MNTKKLRMFTVPMLILLACVMIGTSMPVAAQTDDGEYEELYEKYDLVEVQEVPEGVEPIVVERPEELPGESPES